MRAQPTLEREAIRLRVGSKELLETWEGTGSRLFDVFLESHL